MSILLFTLLAHVFVGYTDATTVNITIDDSFGDSRTGRMPEYGPMGLPPRYAPNVRNLHVC